jgi:hypothetical protein
MSNLRRYLTLRCLSGTLLALAVAWAAWDYTPGLISMLGLDDFELLIRLGAVIGALSTAERIFSRTLARNK